VCAIFDVFYADGLRPDGDDFALNSKEEERVKHGDGIGALSVWDAQLTTPGQANRQPKSRIVLELDVVAIRDLTHDLHVWREPEDADWEGADGHCALQNVWGATKRARKEIRGDLVNISQVRGIVDASK